MSRIPVRASFAMAGAGSLGTFVSAAVQRVLLAIEVHNLALAAGGASEDPRLLHPRWGHIYVDSIGGSSAGALCGGQIVRALHDVRYLGEGQPIDSVDHFCGAWVVGGDFEGLSVEGNMPLSSGAVTAPGWTLLSGARLYQLARRTLDPRGPLRGEKRAHTALDPVGGVGIGITLTDLIGAHDPAEFAPDRVLGHPDFGRSAVSDPAYYHGWWKEVRDLGGMNHAEVRRVFLGQDAKQVQEVTRALRRTRRGRRATAMIWDVEAAERLAALSAASASLPFAIGPLALHDSAALQEGEGGRLYMDGGTLNNRPIAPALNLGRWGDALRILRHKHPRSGEYTREDVEATLCYERVCFFVDAFPEPLEDEWKGPAPADMVESERRWELPALRQQQREEAIARALGTPFAAMDVFAQSMLTSLRAQDIREIAKTNFQVARRRAFIEERCKRPPRSATDFRIDSIDRAEALAAVLQTEAATCLDEQQLIAVTERVWEMDRVAGLIGRREVTMVPVFAPASGERALAGAGLYTMGGLLSFDARVHDARIGRLVGTRVVQALRGADVQPERAPVRDTPAEVRPQDSAQVVERLKVLTIAALEGRARASAVVRFVTGVPLVMDALFGSAQGWLDDFVRGEPGPSEPCPTEEVRLPEPKRED